jgi:hypothetical protein
MLLLGGEFYDTAVDQKSALRGHSFVYNGCMGKWKHRLTSINKQQAMCLNCGPVKIVKSGAGWRCSVARNNTERVAKYRRRYGVDITKNKNKKCDICLGIVRVAYDHGHDDGEFRGWLCMKCNTALGLVHDDINILKKMIEYLQK